MNDLNSGSQHSSPCSVDPLFVSSQPESNISSLESLFKEAAASAKVHLHDGDSFSETSETESFTESKAEDFLPLNLLQDSFSSKLSTLPSHHRDILEKLQVKISYQINYFSVESKAKSDKVQLTCKICQKILHITQVEEHVLDQEHLSNLVNRCNGKISNTSEKNEKLKTSDMPEYTKDTDERAQKSAKFNFVPSSSTPTELNEKSSFIFMNYGGKKLVQVLTDKLKGYNHYFESYKNKWNELYFTCKICQKSLPSKNAKLHIFTNLHFHNLRKNLSVIADFKASSARNKRIVRDLIHLFNNRLYFFQLIYDDELDEIYFVCKVCTLVLVPECLEDHIYTSEHSTNSRENPVVLNFNSLNYNNREVVKELTSTIQIFRIKDFSFVYRIGSEELRFYCKCCELTLIPEKVEDHVYSTEHFRAGKAVTNRKKESSESVATVIATAPSKTALNQMKVTSSPKTEGQNAKPSSADSTIVTKREDELDTEMTFFYRLSTAGTNDPHFNCRLCGLIVKSTALLNHVKCADHIKNRELSMLFNSFVSLEESSKKILRRLFLEVGSELKAFDLAPSFDTIKPRFTCKFCNITLCSDIVANHLQTINHIKRTPRKCQENYATTASRDSLQQLDSKNPSTSKNNQNHAATVTKDSSQPQDSKNLVTKEESSKRCAATVSRGSLQKFDSKISFNDKPIALQTVENADSLSVESIVSPASSGIHEITSDLNFKSFGITVGRESREISDQILSSNHNQGIEPNETLICQNCNITFDFNTAESNDCSEVTLEKFCSSCREKSAETISVNLNNCNASKCRTSGLETTPHTLLERNIDNLHSRSLTNASMGMVSNEVHSCSYKHVLNTSLSELGVPSASNKSGETVSSQKNHCVVKSSTIGNETPLSKLAEENICGRESNEIYPLPTHLSSLKNPSLLEADFLSKASKELLRILIAKINNLDFSLTVNSNELHFCTFCREILPAGSAKSHKNHASFVKYLQLSNASNHEFESNNDRNKTVLRKFLNEIGNKIDDLGVKVTVGFFCKICGANVCAETVADHFSSEMHMQHSRLDSQNVPSKRIKNCDIASLINVEKMCQGTGSYTGSHFPDLFDLRPYRHNLNSRSPSVTCDTCAFLEFNQVVHNSSVSQLAKHFNNDESMLNNLNVDLFFYFFIFFYFISFVYLLFYFKNFLII